MPAEGLVIRWTTRWWDPARRFRSPGQDIAVYAAGTVIGASTLDAAVQPMVWPYLTVSAPAGEVESLLEAAAEAGLLVPAERPTAMPTWWARR